MSDLDAILKELDELEAKATAGEWGWNTYSMVFAGDLIEAEGKLEDEFAEAGSPMDDTFPEYEAEPWRSKFYEADSRVCSVPAHHGDTATGRHAEDAKFICALRNHYRTLADTIRAQQAQRAQRERIEKLEAVRKAAEDVSVKFFDENYSEDIIEADLNKLQQALKEAE